MNPIYTASSKECVFVPGKSCSRVIFRGLRLTPAHNAQRGEFRRGKITLETSLSVSAGDAVAIYVRRRHATIAAAYAEDGHGEGGVSGWEWYVATEGGDLRQGVAAQEAIVVPAHGWKGGYYTVVHSVDHAIMYHERDTDRQS